MPNVNLLHHFIQFKCVLKFSEYIFWGIRVHIPNIFSSSKTSVKVTFKFVQKILSHEYFDFVSLVH